MTEADRYIFRTQGICPPEIHFQIKKGVLTEVDFRGGGCPGNAQLVSRLIRDRSVEEVRPFLKDIQCQNQTSCPAQLDRALEAALDGTLLPAQSFRIAADLWTKNRVALVVGGVDFISVGSAYEDGRLGWGLLTVADAHLHFDVQSFPWTGKGDHE